jgi:hypothetical protein
VMIGRWRSAVVSVVANVMLGVAAVLLGCFAAFWLATQ